MMPRGNAVVRRDGWQASFRSRFEGGYRGNKCGLCEHVLSNHFWWEGLGGNSDEVGCIECMPSQVCHDRKETHRTMSALNLCERCDSLMLGKAVATIRIEDSPSATTEYVELCPACVSDLHDFMHSGPTREQRAFKEPYTKPEENIPAENRKELL